MKLSIRIALFALFLPLFWVACSKSSSSDTGSSRTALLTTGAWKYDTAGIDLDRNGTIDIGDTTITACYKDNTYQFNKDSTGVVNNGTVKCSSSEAQTVAFTWGFTNINQTAIKSNADSNLAAGINISSLTADKFVLYKDTTVLGIQIWYILQLKKVTQ